MQGLEIVSLDWLLDSIADNKMAQASPYSFNSVKNGPIVPTGLSSATDSAAANADKKGRPSRKRRSESPEDDKNSQAPADQITNEPPKKKNDVEPQNQPALKVEVDEYCNIQGRYFQDSQCLK